MEEVSIDALHRSESVKLHRFLLRLLGNPADAADAAQETYLRLIRALSRTEIEQPRVFLFFVSGDGPDGGLPFAPAGQRRRGAGREEVDHAVAVQIHYTTSTTNVR